MQAANLFIKRTTSLATAVSPTGLLAQTPAYSCDSAMLAVTNNSLTGLLVPTFVDPRILWPLPTVVDSIPPGVLVAVPGIRLLTIVAGVATPTTMDIRSCRLIAAGQVARRLFGVGAEDFNDLTQFQIGAYSAARWLLGVTTSPGSVIPTANLADVNGALQRTELIGQSIASVPGYGSGQVAYFDTSSPVFSGISYIESLARAPLMTQYTYPNITVPWNDWVDPAIPANNAYTSVEGANMFDVGLFIDPQRLANAADANSDLYIYIPFACGASTTTQNTSGGTIAVPMTARLSALAPTQGAHGYVIVPLTYLKSHSLYSVAKNPAQTAVAGDYVNNLLKTIDGNTQLYGRGAVFSNAYASLGVIPEQIMPIITSTTFAKANCGPFI